MKVRWGRFNVNEQIMSEASWEYWFKLMRFRLLRNTSRQNTPPDLLEYKGSSPLIVEKDQGDIIPHY